LREFTKEEQQALYRARQMSALAQDKIFKELIINGFIMEGILQYTLREGVQNETVRLQLEARKILNDYIRDTISQGEILLNEQEGA